MHQNLSEINCIFPKNPNFEAIARISPLQPFDENIILLLSEISGEILKDVGSRQYPDVVTFAFWCRKASLKTMKEKYGVESARIGRGVLFHITPSNVPVNFAYSLATGLLAGNANIVRVPTKEFPQVEIIARAFEKVLSNRRYEQLANFVTLLRYHRDDKINKYFSSLCDVRVIWGGDTAINDIRVAPIPPRAFDVTFSDRYSICVINSIEYIKESNPTKVAEGFYNDTYLFDQNACTAPHMIVWLGSNKQVLCAKKCFWQEFYKIASLKYTLQPIQAVDKLTSMYQAAAEVDIKKEFSHDNLIVRGNLMTLTEGIEEYRCNSGFFIEYTAENLEELAIVINSKYQTLAYYGLDPQLIRLTIIKNRLKGIDRIVPIGKTTDFSLYWDGYDLIKTFSRIIDVV